MTNNTYAILCTRPVDQALIRQANDAGIRIDVLPMIDTTPLTSEDMQASIDHFASEKCIIIITSMNAADVVINQLDGKIPHWQFFCTGNTTREILAEYFGKQSIIATAGSAGELAGVVEEWYKKNGHAIPLLFFCGNQRRDELPRLLSQAGISVEEIETYRTVETAYPIHRCYDGILFFSPSAVNSFFSINNAGDNTVLFAIGKTTEHAIRKHSDNEIVVGTHPSKNDLLKQAIAYFHARHTGKNPQ